MRGRLPITILASVAAFALGFQMMKPKHETPVAMQMPPLVSPVTEAALPQPTPVVEDTPPLKIPLDLLSELNFSQFEKGSLEVTEEARYLLGMTEAEAAAISEAARDLCTAVEAYEEKHWESRPDLPIESVASGVAAEIPAMGDVADALVVSFRSQIAEVLGSQHAAFFEVPVKLYKDEVKMLQYIESRERYQVAYLRWNGKDIFSQHASMTKEVPQFLETFFAMQGEETE